jgi:hypothetical protein
MIEDRGERPGRPATVMSTQWGKTMGFFEVLTQVIELLQR